MKTRSPVEVSIEVYPEQGKVRVRALRWKGANKELLRAFLETVTKTSHLYTLKERIYNGFTLPDCIHPKGRLRRTRHGTFCTKCGKKMNTAKIKQRAVEILEIRRKLASAPTVRRTAC